MPLVESEVASAVRIEEIPFAPGYCVGTDGSVWTKWRTKGRTVGRGVESYISSEMRPLKSRSHSDGYPMVSLRVGGKYLYKTVHRLVIETFVGPCPEGLEVLHEDGDKTNCCLTNLRYGTRLENIQDSIRHGTFYRATEAAAKVNTGRKRGPMSSETRAKLSIAQSKRWAASRAAAK